MGVMTSKSKAIAQAKREIENTLGFVPNFYSAIPESAMASTWGVQRDLELSDTALEGKTKELIGLSVAAHIKCKYCIYFHTAAARMHGATDQEIREAIQMGGMTVMFSNAVTGAQTDFDAFKAEVDKGLTYVASQALGQQKATAPTHRHA